MSILPKLHRAARITKKLQIQPGQLVYSKDRISITACFYEFLQNRGHSLLPEESRYLHTLQSTTPTGFGRPCIVLDQLPDRRYTVCFMAQIWGKAFSPLGRFFRVPVGRGWRSPRHIPYPNAPSLAPVEEPSFLPLRLTDPHVTPTHKCRFYLYAIPVVRDFIHLPPYEPRHLVAGDLQRTVNLVRERVMACSVNHAILRREQLQWVAKTYSWRFKNPREGGVHERTYLRI
ncbi:hypothetical protein DFH09DRAFT_1120603 [Mycena vulgaris]|nr:hypothetical protein DFH09DRAFT_1120603 [Mycena vulgaris]